MKISSKLEEMVADLVSDEKAKREDVEAVLSQIHQLTAAYFEPEKEVSPFSMTLHQIEVPEAPAAQDTASLDAQFSNMVQYNVRRNGDSKEDAERKAKMALGIE